MRKEAIPTYINLLSLNMTVGTEENCGIAKDNRCSCRYSKQKLSNHMSFTECLTSSMTKKPFSIKKDKSYSNPHKMMCRFTKKCRRNYKWSTKPRGEQTLSNCWKPVGMKQVIWNLTEQNQSHPDLTKPNPWSRNLLEKLTVSYVVFPVATAPRH
jgi:hypothetical protein